MDISAIILILAMILIGVLLVKVLKNVLLAIFSVVVGGALLVLGVSIFIFTDARQFHDEFYEDDKLILLADDTILAGFDSQGPLRSDEIDVININYRPGMELGTLMGENDRVYIVSSESYEITKYDSIGFKMQYDENVEKKGIIYLLEGVRDNQITISPKSKMVDLSRFLPMFVIKMIYDVIE